MEEEKLNILGEFEKWKTSPGQVISLNETYPWDNNTNYYVKIEVTFFVAARTSDRETDSEILRIETAVGACDSDATNCGLSEGQQNELEFPFAGWLGQESNQYDNKGWHTLTRTFTTTVKPNDVKMLHFLIDTKNVSKTDGEWGADSEKTIDIRELNVLARVIGVYDSDGEN